MPITRDSVFAHLVIVNCYGESSDVWVYYPNVRALLGMLQYIYIPSAFNTKLLGKDNEELEIPMCTVEDLLEIAEDGTNCKHKDLIPVMYEHIEEFEDIWNKEDEEAFNSLLEFSRDFNECWNKDKDIFFYFNVFRTPLDLGSYLVSAYEEDEMLEFLEEDLGLKKDEWINLCNSVYENEFMRRKFVGILNNRIKDMV
jgi:hypothetical protein